MHVFVSRLSQIEPLGTGRVGRDESDLHFLYHITQSVLFYKLRHRR